MTSEVAQKISIEGSALEAMVELRMLYGNGSESSHVASGVTMLAVGVPKHD
jgi:hypothetical protein